MPSQRGRPPQRTAIFFIYLILSSTPCARAAYETSSPKASNLSVANQTFKRNLKPGAPVTLKGLTKATEFNGLAGKCVRKDSATGRWEVQLSTGDTRLIKASNLQPRKEELMRTDESSEDRDVDSAENELSKYSQISDPYKPVQKRDWKSGQGWLDVFSELTGIRGAARDQRYAEAVRAVLPEEYIAESAQFAMCVRVSSSKRELDHKEINLRCTPALNLLPSIQGRDGANRLNFKDVWKGLRDLVDEVKIPNTNFGNDPTGSLWRWMTNWATHKKDRFEREQKKFDEQFSDYFEAQAKASSLSFMKESMSEATSDLMNFGSGLGHTSLDIRSANPSSAWPKKHQPSLGSRYVLCFGRLSHKGKGELDPRQMNKHCSGFWNKDDTKAAIEGIGSSLKWDDTKAFRDSTLFGIRAEILYGSSDADSVSSVFRLVAWNPSSKGLAKTIAKIVRERIAAEGLTCQS